jgi:hypothetical protein
MKIFLSAVLLLSLTLFAKSILAQSLNYSNYLNVTDQNEDQIITEINNLFEKSKVAGENLDISGIMENVNDSLKAGFIDNGNYFNSFNILMKGFKKGIKGLISQKMDIVEKKITVLSEKLVLLTASGNYATKVEDGRILKGKFAWSFVYSKIRDKWKIIHTHMSNPN